MGDLIKIEKNEIEETNGKENRIVDLDLTSRKNLSVSQITRM